MALIKFIRVDSEFILYNFTADSSIDTFTECSDTVRSVGMSKAVFSLIESETVRHAVLLTLLNPQPDGACFAGVNTRISQNINNWANYAAISINIRGQGQYSDFKVVLQDYKSETNSSLAFEQHFDSFIGGTGFATIALPMSQFFCYYRGVRCDEILDLTNIFTLGFQAAGGVYGEVDDQQKGAASVEVNWIELI